ncbi:hypothetical protein HBI24_008960 [Parastagonospora nodorum]|nr:hypothetical protein HBI24_008960 [Parastagonospora nodorum]
MQSATLLRTHCVLCNECIRTANTRRIVRGLENSASASLLVYSDYALQKCSLLTVYALNYLELQVLKLTYGFLSANIIALIGIVLYNAIKEYYDDGTRKIIYFYSYTVEDNYNAICKKSNVTVPDDYYDNDCRTGYSNKEDIEADEREEETKVRLRELLGEIHDILLREFRGADDFTESVIYNDDEQVYTWDEFAMLAEEYIIDNRIVYALALTKDEWELELEDCDALVERYEEEINCSNLYSTV